MPGQLSLVPLSLAVCALWGTSSEQRIDQLSPSSGPPRTIVMVSGTTEKSSVIWDAGGPDETVLPGGLFGADFFSVPPDTAEGVYKVQIERSGARSDPASFTVTAPVPFSPRLDRVSLAYADFSTAGQVNVILYVQGANLDVGAEVRIGGSSVLTGSHKAIRNDLYGVSPEDLEHPIYHFLALAAAPGPRPLGAKLRVAVKNLDDIVSEIEYQLPVSPETMDSDGDYMPDVWEIDGYTKGSEHLDLRKLGAHPFRPDIFVEVDLMQGLIYPPVPETWETVQQAFREAPIINPLTENGIQLVIELGGMPDVDVVVFSKGDTGPKSFFTLKTAHFDRVEWDDVYHYCIWAKALQPPDTMGKISGMAEPFDVDPIPVGDDFVVGIDAFSISTLFHSTRTQAAVFMHELGHNLGLRHGDNDYAYHPAHNSVMSYSWMLRTGKLKSWRKEHPIYFPFYYQRAGAMEVNGQLPSPITNAVDYSDGMGRTLDEAALDEGAGVYGGVPIDYNDNGLIENLSYDLDKNGVLNKLKDVPNWVDLDYSGPQGGP